MAHGALWGHAVPGLCPPEPDTTADTITWNQAPPPIPMPEGGFAVHTSPALPLVLLSERVTMRLTPISPYLVSASEKRSAMLLLAVTTAC